MKAPKLLKALDIIPDDTMDLGPLIEALIPGLKVNNYFDSYYSLLGSDWEHVGTIGIIMSASNADLVRLKAKQHPCVCFRCPEYRLKNIFLSLFLLVLWGLVRVRVRMYACGIYVEAGRCLKLTQTQEIVLLSV